MAFTDEEKLNYSKQALKKKIMQVDDWGTLENFVVNITTQQLKTLINNALTAEELKETATAAVSTTTATDLDDLQSEIDSW